MLAVAVEQIRADFLPERMRPVQPDGVKSLDLDNAKAFQTFDAKY